ncbi:MAG TPA: UDP-3-O-acyl-N-acetylglucosamine deacetylase [Nitrospirae bacterium]|nr:UDP-3-O-acyl-N-acetylglucosamine deacetylase [Nitrospirota bacterium]
MRYQRTIKREISLSGQGLHSGKEVSLTIKPAPRNSGIVFYRKDKDVSIKAHISNVADTAFATSISSRGVKVRTVEHFLSAVSGLGVDNLFVEITGSEMPALDGSAMGYVDKILEAGIAKQAEVISYIKVVKPLIYEDAHSRIMCLPYDGRKISFVIHYNHSLISKQELTILVDEKNFVSSIAPARTFGFLKEVKALQANGLALGGNLDNAIVIGEKDIMNPTGLRFKDEFVRHKILDCIGDFALAGCPVYGHFILEKSGHSSNIKFMTELLSTPECYTYYSPQNNYKTFNPALTLTPVFA